MNISQPPASNSVQATDEELVRRFQAGEPDAAFRILVERHQKKAFRIAYGVLQDEEGARDVCQEAFLRICRALSRFEGRSSFATWLYRIVTNAALDQRRQIEKERAVFFDDRRDVEGEAEGEAPRVWIPGADREVENKDLAAALRLAIQDLSPEHRAVIVLREVEGLSYKEIARTIGCSEGTVMSRIHYARKQLQTALRAVRSTADREGRP